MSTAIQSSGTLLAGALHLCRRLSHNESGSMSVMITIGLMVPLGFAALGGLCAKNDVLAGAEAAANPQC
jgi:hypothetical protein